MLSCVVDIGKVKSHDTHMEMARNGIKIDFFFFKSTWFSFVIFIFWALFQLQQENGITPQVI